MSTLTRTKPPKQTVLDVARQNPYLLIREMCNRSFFEFFKFFWPEISNEELKVNWHIETLCNELQVMAERVANNEPRLYDLIINVPPGTSKTSICSVMFPVWCWTRWFWMKFITVSYSNALALESAEYSRDLVRSDRFRRIYPELSIKDDKDTKSNFRVVKTTPVAIGRAPRVQLGGNRFSTSVEGTLTGYHAHIRIWDDPLNPNQAVSPVELEKTNRWLGQTLSTRSVDKLVSCTIGVMQRLHQNDPTGHQLSKKKNKIRHICLPGEIRNYRDKVQPPELVSKYVNDLLDPVRLNWEALTDLETELGQYGYAGQVGQNPTPPAGGMFKVDHFIAINVMPSPINIQMTVRYWDKAGTKEQADGRGKSAYTVGTKMHKLSTGKWIISDVKRGRWSSEEREAIIRSTAEADGTDVKVYIEQEPGSGGKESAENTVRNLAGFSINVDHPVGDKVYRADPYSVQVNNGNVLLLVGDWNKEFIEEHRHFPFSTYKDQVDSAGAAFAALTGKKQVKVYGKD